MFLRPSSGRLLALGLLYAGHTLVTLLALRDFGLVGIFRQGFLNTGTAQIFSDLSFALVLVCAWLAADARRRGVAAWPWLLGTLVFGSLSPGLYLLVREIALRRAPTAAQVAGV